MYNVKPARWSYALLVVAAIAFGGIANSCRRPTAKPYTVGLVTWIGYGPIYIAQEKGFFRANGIDVRVQTLDGPGAREAAYQAGELDFFPNTPDAFVIFFSDQPFKGKMIAALDESEGADGVIAKAEVGNIRNLKGRRVGFQSGITSHFLLLYLLRRAGLTGKDITQIDLSASDAGQAFIAGKLDAAVTWEPWLSEARKSPRATVLATSADTPGLIVDIMLASDRVLSEGGRPAKSFMNAWKQGVAFIRNNPEEAAVIISKALNVKPVEVTAMLRTTRFYTPRESTDYLSSKLPAICNDAADLFFDNGVIRRKPDLRSMIDVHVADGEQ